LEEIAALLTSVKMSPRQIAFLIEELCVDLGFCLPPEAQARIQEKPETDIDLFTDAVIRAEGLDPQVDISLNLRRVRAVVVKHFRAAGNELSA
jgi:hypothetical protein